MKILEHDPSTTGNNSFEEAYFVGSNPYRISRMQQLGETNTISWQQYPLKEDPPSPLGFRPQYIVAEKALLALASLQRQHVKLPHVIVAMDTLNGIVTHNDDKQEIIFKSKPISLDEVKSNIALFRPLEDEHACFQADIAHAVIFPNDMNASAIVTTKHKGYIPLDRLTFLQSNEGWERFNSIVSQHRIIQPLQISSGIPWPILFMMNTCDRLDEVFETNSVPYIQKKGEILRHVISFDEHAIQLGLTGSSLDTKHEVLPLTTYLDMKLKNTMTATAASFIR